MRTLICLASVVWRRFLLQRVARCTLLCGACVRAQNDIGSVLVGRLLGSRNAPRVRVQASAVCFSSSTLPSIAGRAARPATQCSIPLTMQLESRRSVLLSSALAVGSFVLGQEKD